MRRSAVVLATGCGGKPPSPNALGFRVQGWVMATPGKCLSRGDIKGFVYSIPLICQLLLSGGQYRRFKVFNLCVILSVAVF